MHLRVSATLLLPVDGTIFYIAASETSVCARMEGDFVASIAEMKSPMEAELLLDRISVLLVSGGRFADLRPIIAGIAREVQRRDQRRQEAVALETAGVPAMEDAIAAEVAEIAGEGQQPSRKERRIAEFSGKAVKS